MRPPFLEHLKLATLKSSALPLDALSIAKFGIPRQGQDDDVIMDDTMAIHACPLVTQRVVLRGLKSEDFNGRFGEVMGFDNTTGRYIVSDFER